VTMKEMMVERLSSDRGATVSSFGTGRLYFFMHHSGYALPDGPEGTCSNMSNW
jgi:hypothetical protein